MNEISLGRARSSARQPRFSSRSHAHSSRISFISFEENPLNQHTQPELLSRLTLTVNEDIKNRVTYSVLMQKLAPDSVADFVRAELDKVALAHSTFTDDALSLIVRSSEGVLRRARNLCLSALLETVRDRTKTVDLKQVNRVLLQPHWRRDVDLPQ